jgi:flagellin
MEISTMAMTVNTNIASLNAYRNLSNTSGALNKSMEKLSSGFRINRAADDAAGLVNSESLRSQIGGLTVATRNAQDGISVAQTAEGSLNEVTSILQRARDLTVQKANTGGNSTDANDAIDAEMSQLGEEINRIGTTSKYNGQDLFSSTGYAGKFQVGANDSDTITMSFKCDLSAVATALRTSTPASAGTPAVPAVPADPNATPPVVGSPAIPAVPASPASVASANPTIQAIDDQLKTVTTARGTIGAVQNRFEHTIANLGVAVENLTASESRIRDTDVASEMTNLSKNQILSQAGTAMLAQANQSAQSVLTLLRG